MVRIRTNAGFSAKPGAKAFRLGTAERGINLRRIASRFLKDESGNYAIITALLAPALLGFAGLATENGLWLYSHQTMQGAADTAAFSAANEYGMAGDNGANLTTQAGAIAASYGFRDAANGVTVTVNRPPKSGSHVNSSDAVEVIISQTQPRLFSAIWSDTPVTITARAVALGGSPFGCVLALDRSASAAANTQGTPDVTLKNCDLYDDSSDPNALNVGGSARITARTVGVVGGVSGGSNITTTNGLVTGHPVVPDPYASTSFPSFSGCDRNNFIAKAAVTINPGVYCNGMTLNAGAIVTMKPGTYYIDRGTLKVNGGATLTGTGVTIVFTSSTGKNWATAAINGGAVVNINAPNSGPLSGIAIYGDRSIPAGSVFKFNGGSTMVFGGAVYLPTAAIDYAGGGALSTTCTQLIGDTIQFSGNSSLAVNCSGYGTRPISMAAQLVE